MDAFSKVDDMVSKPVLGSDGAKAWQEFAKKNPSRAATSAAPTAPLKAQERAMGYTSWSDERTDEIKRREEEGKVSLEQAGYTHFKRRGPANCHKRKGVYLEQEEQDDNDKQTNLKGAAEELATIQAEQVNEKVETVDVKRKKSRKTLPKIVHDPSHPIEQVAAALQHKEQDSSPNLPPGWHSAEDPSNRKVYYYHATTGERSWTKPSNVETVSESLPEGWTTAQDPATGKKYYYHTTAQITQWEAPNSETSKASQDSPEKNSGKSSSRGRYKKLKKKAMTVVTQAVSGLVSLSDWHEFIELCRSFDDDALTEYVPRIKWRSKRQKKQRPRVEAATHRDILFYLLGNKNLSTKDRVSTVNAFNDAIEDPGGTYGTQVGGSSGSAPPEKALPPWVTIHNVPGISSVVLVEVHLPSSELYQSILERVMAQFGDSSRCLHVSTRWFNNVTPKSITESLLYASPPKSAKRNEKEERVSKINSVQDLFTALQGLVLNAGQMEKEGYPMADLPKGTSTFQSSESDPTRFSLSDSTKIIEPFQVTLRQNMHGSENGETYVSCSAVSPGASVGQIYSMDCEMVDTVAGKALARFTLLQVEGYNVEEKQAVVRVVWDTLVQPDAKVTDYLTKWSGVSESSLAAGPFVCLAQVQAFLLHQVQPHDILIGHSLENDLHACRYIHYSCVDTALLFRPPNRSFKYSLKNLSYRLLKRSIQKSNHAHCSQEDAQASLDLAIRRAVEGPSFFFSDTRSRNQWSALAKNRTTVAIGPNDWLQKHITSQPSSVHALCCESVQDDTRKAGMAWLGGKRRADLAWSCFRLASDVDGDLFLKYMTELMNKVSWSDTVVGLALQCGYGSAATLFGHRQARQSAKATMGWTDEEERKFNDLVQESQNGAMLWFSSN